MIRGESCRSSGYRTLYRRKQQWIEGNGCGRGRTMGSKCRACGGPAYKGKQEVIIQNIDNRFLKGLKGFAGATILGDGNVALIIDVGTLI